MRGLLLVTDLPPATLEPMVKQALAAADPNLTVTSVRTLQQQVDRSFDQQRAVASLAGTVRHRRARAGGDRALRRDRLHGRAAHERDRHPHGARRRSRQGRRHGAAAARSGASASGLLLGLPLAVGAGYLLSAQLYGVQFWDPLALGVSALSLATCAFFAAVIPARRAASISPIRALRSN